METAKLIKLGNGLSVPSVLELAKHSFTEIPSRYICTDQNPVNIGESSSIIDETVPVIDLQNLLSAEPNTRKLELDNLHSASQRWGFFQVVNHGVNALLMENVKSEIEKFFNLSMNDKTRYGQKEGEGEGFGQHFVNSDDQRLDWADMFYMVTLPHHLRNPYLFPQLPIPLREAMESYSLEMNKLAMILLDMMGKALQVETKVMTGPFEDGLQSMRMNYYPPCPRPELVIGLTPHSDFGGLTILLQVNEVEGLQIRKEDRWISIKPLPNAFIVNIGDLLEVMTNGIYRSVEHRAITNSTKKRLSIATFHDPKLEAEIGPISSLITPETPALFTRLVYEKLLKKMESWTLDGKSFLDSMRVGESG